MNLGKTCDLDVARVLPFQFCTFNMMGMEETASFPSINNSWQCFYYHCCFLTSGLRMFSSADGPWAPSLLSTQLSSSKLTCQAHVQCLRDSRRLPPVDVCHASRNFHSISRESKGSIRARALVHFCSIEVLYFRFPATTHNFTCSRMQHEHAFQYDCAIESRCQFYAMAGFVDFLPSSKHMTIGLDHHWDIARRMRQDLSQRAIYV